VLENDTADRNSPTLLKSNNTAMLATAAFAFATLIGVPLGVLSAVKRGGFWDRGVRSFAVLGTSGHPRPSHKFN
jgi:ABC-type dipeptide/oligopeptide/nickel transport system permease component